MLRRFWVLLWPLLISLMIYSGAMLLILACSAGGSVLFGGVGGDVSAAWVQARPAILSGAVFFVALAVARWGLHLALLRRVLRERRTSLREYSRWSASERSKWLKDDTQIQGP